MFSTESFYSPSPKGVTKRVFLNQLKKRKKVEDRENIYKERPLCHSQVVIKRIFSERKTWKWFHRQHEALEYCVAMKYDQLPLCLFAYEKSDGKRRFLVTTLQQFWTKYSAMQDSDRHFYEVISMDDTCRLYFDIEFQRDLNKDLNGNTVLYTFINFVCHCLHQEFQIDCCRSDVVDLDSSTDSKFSRHLIFHVDHLFVNNINCGEFVREVCYCLKTFVKDDKANKYLPVNCTENKENPSVGRDCCDKEMHKHLATDDLKKILIKGNGIETYLCDLSVYSKNRNFRLYMSSKVSKKIPLVISKENKFEFKTKPTRRERDYYRYRGELFDADFQKFTDTLICCNDHCENILTFNDKDSSIITVQKSDARPHKEGTHSTQFPCLDEFVMEHAQEKCKRGTIRSWLMFDRSKLIIYNIQNNRWCGHVQREHKGNGVYYVADLKCKVLYQKCHDPDCINYRSNGVKIPDELNPMMENEEIAGFDVSLDVELNRLFSDTFEGDSKLLGGKSGNKEGDDHKFNEVDDAELSKLLDEDFEEDLLCLSKLNGVNAENIKDDFDVNAENIEDDFDVNTGNINDDFDDNTENINDYFDVNTENRNDFFDDDTENIKGHFDYNTENINDYFDVNTENINDFFDDDTENIKGHFDVNTENIKGDFDVNMENIKHDFGEFNDVEFARLFDEDIEVYKVPSNDEDSASPLIKTIDLSACGECQEENVISNQDAGSVVNDSVETNHGDSGNSDGVEEEGIWFDHAEESFTCNEISIEVNGQGANQPKSEVLDLKENIDLQDDRPGHLEFNTPVRSSSYASDGIELSGDLIPSFSSPMLVSTHKREFIKSYRDGYNQHNTKNRSPSYQQALNKQSCSFKDSDSKILNDIFCGDNSVNEFSVIL